MCVRGSRKLGTLFLSVQMAPTPPRTQKVARSFARTPQGSKGAQCSPASGYQTRVCRTADPLRVIRGDLTGPNRLDRGKSGSKIHVITERTGLPISVGISAANTHDNQALEPLVRGIPPIRSRGIIPRIARRGIESSQRLGRHRWVVELTVSCLAGCRRLCQMRRRLRGPRSMCGSTVNPDRVDLEPLALPCHLDERLVTPGRARPVDAGPVVSWSLGVSRLQQRGHGAVA